MKHLKDFEGEAAIELWADLVEPITSILADKEVKGIFEADKPIILIAKEILKSHKDEVSKILLTVDPTPLNGLNVVTRTADIILEIMNDDDIKNFLSQSLETEE